MQACQANLVISACCLGISWPRRTLSPDIMKKVTALDWYFASGCCLHFSPHRWIDSFSPTENAQMSIIHNKVSISLMALTLDFSSCLLWNHSLSYSSLHLFISFNYDSKNNIWLLEFFIQLNFNSKKFIIKSLVFKWFTHTIYLPNTLYLNYC